MRYWDGISYKVTSWSDPISSNSTDIKFLTNDDLKYSIPDGAYFLFDSELKQLQIKFDGSEKEITDIPNFDSYIDGKGFRPSNFTSIQYPKAGRDAESAERSIHLIWTGGV